MNFIRLAANSCWQLVGWCIWKHGHLFTRHVVLSYSSSFRANHRGRNHIFKQTRGRKFLKYMFELIVISNRKCLLNTQNFLLVPLREQKLFNKTSKHGESQKETLHVWACYTPKISNLIKQTYPMWRIFYSFSWKTWEVPTLCFPLISAISWWANEATVQSKT